MSGLKTPDARLNDFLTCFRCGVCCTRYQVRLSIAEARLLAGKLNQSWEEWLKKYTDSRWPGVDSLLLCHRDGACVFLERPDDGRITTCLIEPFKPSSCKAWAADFRCAECQDGLYRYWGLRVSPAGRLTGPEQKLLEFRAFLGSLTS